MQALVPRLGGELVAAQRPGVLLGAADAELGRDLLGAGTQRLGPLRGEGRVDQPPADGRPHHLHLPGHGLVGLGHDVRRPAHALDTTGQDELVVADPDRARRLHDRLGTGGAEPVDGHAGHADRQPGEQRGHPADIAVLLARSVGVAQDHVVDLCGIDFGVAREQLGDRCGGEVVGAHAREAAAEAAERGAYGVEEVGVHR